MNIETLVRKFWLADAEKIEYSRYGSGHINETYILNADGKNYIIQKINTGIFKDPDGLMNNFVAVTEYLSEQLKAEGKDYERGTLHVIRTVEGKNYASVDSEAWRLINFVDGSVCYDKVEFPEQFYMSAVAFGDFQRVLKGFPAEKLVETIPNFHNTPDRFAKFCEAVEKDAVGRVKDVLPEIDFVKVREHFAGTLERAHAEGKLPLKVTHNDTKLNNILFDAETGKALCIIDLDTVMPGYSVNDFGDSIRFGATTAAEDETDLSLVNFDIDLYELYVKGFIEGAAGGLTEGELQMLPVAAMMMTYECGMRFLTDHISGDTYFRIHREGHNLDRARNQFKLLSDMEECFDEMQNIVKKYTK
jgi:Ser/Thr protein kinase RdoA (MazF antagonist)